MDNKGCKYWLPRYIWQSVRQKEKPDLTTPIHIMIGVVDHFEPFTAGADFSRAKMRVSAWNEKYPRLADKHKDADGKAIQHTWFYPPHHDHIFLIDLVDLCKNGFGEIEMHLHHNHMPPFPDTDESLKEKIKRCIEDYSKHGIFCLPDGRKKFAFIHGDWSLDNSRGNDFCGVNNEIALLKDCGCYADFTFPSLGIAQPAFVNKIYYVKDDPILPKSYEKGREVEAGREAYGDLLLVTGIIGLRWKSRIHKFKPSIEASNIGKSDRPFPERINYWVKNGIKIKGSPNWIFIKLHTHGAAEENWNSLLGQDAEEMFTYLEENFNDGIKYSLHYVSAREMFNIIKAAESGKEGNPGNFRDFLIPKYTYLKGA